MPLRVGSYGKPNALICGTRAFRKSTALCCCAFSRGVEVSIEVAEKLNARFFRFHPELGLCADADGLWLCANGMKMQPDWKAEVPRLKRASLKSEMIARACHLTEKPKLIDATAGLGHDSLLMAHLGANVTLVERHPILFTLLESSKEQALQDAFLNPVVTRIDLVFSDSAQYLQQQAEQGNTVDVVYLDPMFPQRDQNQQAVKKQAQVKSKCSFYICYCLKMVKWIWVIICLA